MHREVVDGLEEFTIIMPPRSVIPVIMSGSLLPVTQ
jgi:hypothetical protein